MFGIFDKILDFGGFANKSYKVKLPLFDKLQINHFWHEQTLINYARTHTLAVMKQHMNVLFDSSCDM